MSGGVAYVHDPDGRFPVRCNQSMADLEKVEPATKAMEPLAFKGEMLDHDEMRLKTLIERHLHYTDSDVARALLARWDEARAEFVKVMPRDFRRALTEMQAEDAAEGRSETHG